MFSYKSTLDALASAMEDCTQNRDSEQEDKKYFEETTEEKENKKDSDSEQENENYFKETAEEKENKIAKQEKCKRLLPAMIESLMESLENVLRKYRNYLENYWDYETFEENEEYLNATAEAAEWYCNYHSNLWRWGWKEESEDSWGM
jgi:chromatin remodeling complex protein RSC6